MFVWDDSMRAVVGMDVVRLRLLPCLEIFFNHGQYQIDHSM